MKEPDLAGLTVGEKACKESQAIAGFKSLEGQVFFIFCFYGAFGFVNSLRCLTSAPLMFGVGSSILTAVGDSVKMFNLLGLSSSYVCIAAVPKEYLNFRCL